MVLHIVNGDHFATRLTESGIAGIILPWREVLHEGPMIPFESFDVTERNAFNKLRAQFIDEQRWGRQQEVMRDMASRDQLLLNRPWDEIIIWSERDLFDQLIIGHALHLLLGTGHFTDQTVSLAFSEHHLTMLSNEEVDSLYTRRSPLTESVAEMYSKVFEGVTKGAIQEVPTDAPPALADAVRRWRELQPGDDGLSAFDKRMVEIIKPQAPVGVDALFSLVREQDGDDAFWGDTVFASHMRHLAERVPQLRMDRDTIHWAE